MRFKSWRDYYLFIREYVKFSCLNCRYCGDKLDVDEEHTDGDYARHFCTFNIAMVRFDFQTLCTEWESPDGHKLPYDDERNFLFDEELDKMFDEDDGKLWSIDEIREVIKDYEEVKE